MLGDIERPALPTFLTSASHQDNRTCVCEDVALAQWLPDQVVEQDVGGCVEVKASDLMRVIGMGLDLGNVGAEVFPEEFSGSPIVFFAKNVMVEVLEKLELDRLGEPLGGLDAIDDDTAAASDKLAIEEGDGTSQDPGEIGLPDVPLVGVEVTPGHSATGPGKWVQVIADRSFEVPDIGQVRGVRKFVRGNGPAELLERIVGMILGITATGQVANHPPASLSAQAGIRPPEAKLGFPSSGRSGDDRQCAREKTSAEHFIEPLKLKLLPGPDR